MDRERGADGIAASSCRRRDVRGRHLFLTTFERHGSGMDSAPAGQKLGRPRPSDHRKLLGVKQGGGEKRGRARPACFASHRRS